MIKRKCDVGDWVRIVKAPRHYSVVHPDDEGVVTDLTEHGTLRLYNLKIWGQGAIFVPHWDVEPISVSLREENLQAELEKLREVSEIKWDHARFALADAEEKDNAWKRVYDRLENLRRSSRIGDSEHWEYANMTNTDLVKFWRETQSDYAMREAVKEMAKRLNEKGENK